MRPFQTVVAIGLLFAAATGCGWSSRAIVSKKSLRSCRELSQQGIAAADSDDWQKAESLLAQAVRACPVDPQARLHYAEALCHRGALAEAAAQLNEAVRLAPPEASLRIRAAELQFALGNVDAARTHVDEAIDLEPQTASAWALRGKIRAGRGEWREALADYHRALGYEPESMQYLLEIAELYRRLGEPQRALVNLQAMIETCAPGQEPPQALYLEGLALAALDRPADAAESFRGAIERGGGTPELWFRLAEADLAAGRAINAQRSVAQALALDPEHVPSKSLSLRLARGGPASTEVRRARGL